MEPTKSGQVLCLEPKELELFKEYPDIKNLLMSVGLNSAAFLGAS
jgi:hypothetical protein